MGFFYIGDEATDAVATNGDDVAVLLAGGELDYAASPQLKERLGESIDAGARHLVLDLSMATFIDSTAIGVLVGTVMRLREDGGSLTIVCAEENQRVLRIFEIAGVDSLITLHRSREEALSALVLAG
ncbi:MAG TPA: STAS domain-containing protein [Solirubrobacteraceae bacterium]|jgi:anti-sigma B factor antagonist